MVAQNCIQLNLFMYFCDDGSALFLTRQTQHTIYSHPFNIFVWRIMCDLMCKYLQILRSLCVAYKHTHSAIRTDEEYCTTKISNNKHIYWLNDWLNDFDSFMYGFFKDFLVPFQTFCLPRLFVITITQSNQMWITRSESGANPEACIFDVNGVSPCVGWRTRQTRSVTLHIG